MWVKTQSGRVFNLDVFRSLDIEAKAAGEFDVVARDGNGEGETLATGSIEFCERVRKVILGRLARGVGYLDYLSRTRER